MNSLSRNALCQGLVEIRTLVLNKNWKFEKVTTTTTTKFRSVKHTWAFGSDLLNVCLAFLKVLPNDNERRKHKKIFTIFVQNYEIYKWHVTWSVKSWLLVIIILSIGNLATRDYLSLEMLVTHNKLLVSKYSWQITSHN